MICDRPPLTPIRDRTGRQLAMFHDSVRRLLNPHHFPVGLERKLHELKTALILQARGHNADDDTEWSHKDAETAQSGNVKP